MNVGLAASVISRLEFQLPASTKVHSSLGLFVVETITSERENKWREARGELDQTVHSLSEIY